MPGWTYHVLCWGGPGPLVTAQCVENLDTALGADLRQAIDQLERQLTSSYKAPAGLEAPQLENDVFLRHWPLKVRPQYLVDERIYPSGEPITVTVPVIYGPYQDDLGLGLVPWLRLKFHYKTEQELRSAVNHYVGTALQGLSPRELARLLSVKSVSLERVQLRLRALGGARVGRRRFPSLEAIAEPIDATAIKQQFSPAWERDTEVSELVTRLERQNVLVVGETAIGRSTVIAAVARAYASSKQAEKPNEGEEEEERPRNVARVWRTSAGRIVAGMSYLGQWEERLEEAVRELGAIHGILWVESLVELMRTGGAGPADSVAAYLLPTLRFNELRLITVATPAELEVCRRLLPALMQHLEVYPMRALQPAQSKGIVKRYQVEQQRDHQRELEEGIPTLVCSLFSRFQPYRALPGPALELLRHVVDRAHLAGRQQISREEVLEAFIQQTGLHPSVVREDSSLPRETLLAELEATVKGQRAACEAVIDRLLAFKVGLTDPGRPVGVFLFSGPTGVGKTALARRLADYLFGAGKDKDRLIRLDMSEYSGGWGAERLLTRADGEPSELIRRMREQPFGVVLFDEIEKADPEVFDVLLSVFDEGKLTDRFGRLTSFASSLIILTSNLGAASASRVGFGAGGGDSSVKAVRAFFRPELFNRIDRIVPFSSLGPEVVREIAALELAQVCRREGVRRRELKLAFSEEVIDLVAVAGFDPLLGARPMQRALERLVIVPLSTYLVTRPDVSSRTLTVTVGAGREVEIGE